MDFRKLLTGKSRKIVLFVFDVICFVLIDLLYFIFAAYSHYINAPDSSLFIRNSILLIVSIFSVRVIFRVYVNIWRYTNTYANLNLVISDLCGTVLTLILSAVIGIWEGMWHISFVALVNLIAALTSRFCYRLVYKHINRNESDRLMENVAIVGAGQLGAFLVDELRLNSHSNYRPVFFVDNDTTKTGSRISGIPVFHDGDDIAALIKKFSVSEIFIAINNLDSDLASWLYNYYSKTGCQIKIYDTPVREFTGKSKKRIIRDFQIEDLLFRKPLSLEDCSVKDYYAGKTVLVTGGGGSIGSELCRQVAACGPKKLIILDIYENNAYDIQQELYRDYGENINLAVEIASVRDRKRLNCIFKYYRPDIVFHAAAHKHVPLMEHSGCEAIKNNVIGTYNVADMAEKYETKKFILISTDKAVNPTNIMGASKRLCEMTVQSRVDSKTSFAAVRFGNVLGSNGSVIPLFKQQIAEGGPITITDKRIIRYFMTIPEASQLVMQTGAMAKMGELFVLDMGKPVRIYDLAVNMIKLSGLEPNIDIKIEEIGLRPGEKLYEELLMKTEHLTKTENNMIFIEKDVALSRSAVDEKIRILNDAVAAVEAGADKSYIRYAVANVVPTFHDPNEVNCTAESSYEMKIMQMSN